MDVETHDNMEKARQLVSRISYNFPEDARAMESMLPFDERIFRRRREEILTEFAQEEAATDIDMTLTELTRRVCWFWFRSGVRDNLISFHQEESRRVRALLEETK
jgi:hypothetical protein